MACVVCGKAISETYSTMRKYCSHECSLKARRKRWKANHTTVSIDKKCDHCGKKFVAARSPTVHCSEECKRSAYNLRQNSKRKKVEHAPKKCEQCAKEYTPIRRNSRYCSIKCGQRAKYLRSKGLTEEDFILICLNCEEEFKAVFASGRQLYCSKDCKNEAYREANPEYFTERWKIYYEIHREHLSKASSRWGEKNPGLNTYLSAKRKKRIKQATPPWADLDAIRLFYAFRPEGMEVDHIIPISGKNICGLNIVDNLQYLSRSANASKNNKFDGGW